MEYQQALDYIHSLLKFGTRPGLERVSALLERMGNPQDNLKFIHVAGTNGKGSTCEMINRALQEAGYRTGMFTSPYVVEFRERMQCNSRMIGDEALVRLVEQMIPIIEELGRKDLQPTEFEVVTALAFQWFLEQECDVVVLEVGLGGRFDSTNVISVPLVSVITSISFDHMTVLGNTLAEIAGEKCGIIKPYGVTVSAPGQPQEAAGVIWKAAEENKNTLVIPDSGVVEILSQTPHGTELLYDGFRLHIPLLGVHQVGNALTAVCALKALRDRGLNVSDKAIADGIANARIPARMELLSASPMVILDGAHNEDGARALSESLQTFFQGKRFHALLGMMGDKEYEKAVSYIAPLCESIITTVPSNPRALDAEKLAQVVYPYCPSVQAVDDPAEAFDTAYEELGPDEVLIIGGSLYLAADLRAYVLEKTK